MVCHAAVEVRSIEQKNLDVCVFFFTFSFFFGGHPTNSSLTIFQFIPCSFPTKLIDDRQRTRSPRTRRYRTKITSLSGNDEATEELVTPDFRWFRPPSKIHSAIAPRKSELAMQFIYSWNVLFLLINNRFISKIIQWKILLDIHIRHFFK